MKIRKSFPFNPKQMVKAKQACSMDGSDGQPYTFGSNSSAVRADHPAVELHPDLFEAVDPEYPAEPAA